MLFARARVVGRRSMSSMVVHTWGTGTDGQLGHGAFEKSGMMNSYQELSPKLLTASGAGVDKGPIVNLACGTTHTAAVSEEGALFTWGKGEHEQLGHGGEDDQLSPKFVEGMDGVDLTKVSCGTNHTAALDSDGNVWSWGWGGSFWSGTGGLGHDDSGNIATPRRVEALVDQGIRARDVTCGERHTVIVTEDDQVWLCGNGEYGRMGNGGSSDQPTPEPVDFFLDFDVAQAVAGHSFTLCLTRCGKVYAWGRNDQAQLGLGGGLSMDVYAMEAFPNPVEGLMDRGITKLAAGQFHAAAISEKGELLMWGMKRYLEPEYFSELKDKFVKDVACGGNFTAVLTEDGELYTFGKGRSNGLGHGDRKTTHQPRRVEALRNSFVHSIACGANHMAVTSTPR